MVGRDVADRCTQINADWVQGMSQDSRNRLTPEQARAYAQRWELVNDREGEELRAMTHEQKLRQLAALMASAKALGWDEALDAEDAEVRERWQRLREILNE